MGVRVQRTAVVAPGNGAAAMAFAAEIAKYSTDSLAMPTTWGMVVGGTYGKLCWFTDFADMAALEAGTQRLLQDQGYNEILTKGEQLFIPGTGEDQVIWMP